MGADDVRVKVVTMSAVSTRRPVFVWLVAATFLPAIVTIGAAAFGHGVPVKAVSVLFGVAHVPTTFGLYADPDMRPFLRSHLVRCFAVPMLLIVGAASAAVLAPPWLLPYLIGGFVCWQLHHFTKQNLGMLSFWCRANRLGGSDALERHLIVATGVAAMLGMSRFLPAYQGGRLPLAEILYPLGALVLIGAGTMMVARAAPERRLPLVAVSAFYLPLWLFPDNLGAAILGFVAAHGAQYFLMVGHLAAARRWLPWVLVGSSLVGGILMRSPSSGLLWGAVVGVTMSHFVVDAGLWRMRDPERRTHITSRFRFLAHA